MKEDGLVYAYCISVIVSCLYIEGSVRSIRDCSLKAIKKELLCKIIRFSAPLIPNSVSWWVVSSVNRIIIVAVIGYAANGIFSMANKFASIITMIGSTFILAWQEYVLTQKDNTDKVKLFSNVFHVFFYILACCTAGGTLLQQIFFNTLIDAEYAESFFYIPIIMLTVAVSTLNSFWGVGYFAYEKTSGAFKTTIVGAVANLFLGCVLIRVWGLYGVAFAGLIAYLLMWIVRCITMKSYFYIQMKPGEMIVPAGMVLISFVAYYLNKNLVSIVFIGLICIIFLLKYKSLLLEFLKKRRG
jgi:O-antigen/teichoic acid export membrane protein